MEIVFESKYLIYCAVLRCNACASSTVSARDKIKVVVGVSNMESKHKSRSSDGSLGNSLKIDKYDKYCSDDKWDDMARINLVMG